MTLYAGDTVRFKVTIRDFDEHLIDPDTHSITIYDESRVRSGSVLASPTRDSIGVFHQDFNVPSDAEHGMWRCVWIAVKNSAQKTAEILFRVDEAPGDD